MAFTEINCAVIRDESNWPNISLFSELSRKANRLCPSPLGVPNLFGLSLSKLRSPGCFQTLSEKSLSG
jgi:hypothetical protein